MLLLPLLLCLLLRSVRPVGVQWMAPFLSGGGYASEALEFAKCFNHTSILFTARHHGDTVNQDYIFKLTPENYLLLQSSISRKQPLTEMIVVCHSEPGAWEPARYYTSPCPPRHNAYRIGRTMFETDRIPGDWLERLNGMDEIWVPTEFSYDIFLRSGVPKRKLFVVGEPIDTSFYAPRTDFLLPRKSPDFRFASVFKWEKRKGWDVLLKAYFSVFTASDPVVLFILTSAYHDNSDFERKITRFLRTEFPALPRDRLARYQVHPSLSEVDLVRFYSSIDCLVQPSRGEGWGRPHMEAMSVGLPVIATNWSGNLAFMNEGNSYLIPCLDLRPVGEGPFRNHKWCEPDAEWLGARMRFVFEHPSEAKSLGDSARRDMVERFDTSVFKTVLERHYARIVSLLEAEGEL